MNVGQTPVTDSSVANRSPIAQEQGDASSENTADLSLHASSTHSCLLPLKSTESSLCTTSVMSHSQTSSEDESCSEKQQRKMNAIARYLRLLKENRRLKRRQLCRLCGEREVSITLLPCGHFLFCQPCATSMTRCVLCRKEIMADVRTFLS